MMVTCLCRSNIVRLNICKGKYYLPSEHTKLWHFQIFARGNITFTFRAHEVIAFSNICKGTYYLSLEHTKLEHFELYLLSIYVGCAVCFPYLFGLYLGCFKLCVLYIYLGLIIFRLKFLLGLVCILKRS